MTQSRAGAQPVALVLVTIMVSLLALVLYYRAVIPSGAESAGRVTSSSASTVHPDIPTWTPGEPDAAAGMSYVTPAEPPGISRERAIEIAGSVGFSPGYAPKVSARYELMSFENSQAWAHQLTQEGLQHHTRGFVDIPVWVVSYEGLRMEPSGPPAVDKASLRPEDFNHELNIVISAETGAYLGGFTYR